MNWRSWLDSLMGDGADGRVLTRARIRAAYAVAVAVDLVQFFTGPFGWVFSDEILDVVALFVTSRLIGFHPLLLPTFLLEFLPITDMLPTWTGCVALVVALRKKPAAPHTLNDPNTIDVTPERATSSPLRPR
jgi:hypothetical protein